MNETRLKLRTKLAYSCGDLGCCLMNYMVINYFMFYCTNMIGLSLVTVGMIMFICRVWDAANDIVVGALVDRTNTKVGKARPWIKWFAIPCALSCFMMFSAPAGASNFVKVLWVGGGYFLFALFYTTVNLPYGSMLPLMTKNSDDRAALSTFRLGGAYAGILIVNAAALPMVSFFGNLIGGRTYAYTIVTAIMCLGGVFFFAILYRKCKETVYEENMKTEQEKPPEQRVKEKRGSVLKDVSYLLRNPPWLIIFGIMFISFLRQPFTSTSMAYYFVYYFQVDETQSALFSSLGMVVCILALPFISKVVEKFGYKKSMVFCFVVVSLAGFGAYACGKNITAVLICYLVMQMMGALPGVAGLAMLADTLEYGDLKFGVRLEGLGTAAYSFSTKAGPAIGSLLVTVIYAMGGLDTTMVLGDRQSGGAIFALRFAMFLLPSLLCLIQAVLSFIYPLTEEKYKKVLKALDDRNAGLPTDTGVLKL